MPNQLNVIRQSTLFHHDPADSQAKIHAAQQLSRALDASQELLVAPDETGPLKLQELQQPEQAVVPIGIPAKIEAAIECDAAPLTERSSELLRAVAKQTDTVTVSATLPSLTAEPLTAALSDCCPLFTVVPYSLQFVLFCGLFG